MQHSKGGSVRMTREELSRRDAQVSQMAIRGDRAYVLMVVREVLGDWAVSLLAPELDLSRPEGGPDAGR